jgi:hypothetical protein
MILQFDNEAHWCITSAALLGTASLVTLQVLIEEHLHPLYRKKEEKKKKKKEEWQHTTLERAMKKNPHKRSTQKTNKRTDTHSHLQHGQRLLFPLLHRATL